MGLSDGPQLFYFVCEQVAILFIQTFATTIMHRTQKCIASEARGTDHGGFLRAASTRSIERFVKPVYSATANDERAPILYPRHFFALRPRDGFRFTNPRAPTLYLK